MNNRELITKVLEEQLNNMQEFLKKQTSTTKKLMTLLNTDEDEEPEPEQTAHKPKLNKKAKAFKPEVAEESTVKEEKKQQHSSLRQSQKTDFGEMLKSQPKSFDQIVADDKSFVSESSTGGTKRRYYWTQIENQCTLIDWFRALNHWITTSYNDFPDQIRFRPTVVTGLFYVLIGYESGSTPNWGAASDKSKWLETKLLIPNIKQVQVFKAVVDGSDIFPDKYFKGNAWEEWAENFAIKYGLY